MVRHPAKRDCVDLAAEGLLQGMFTGAAFGPLMALYQRRLHPEPNALRQVGRCLANSLVLFSALLSVYHGCTCVAARVRGREDVLNACVGGAVAGLLVSLPLRNARVIAQNAAGMACVGGSMDRIANTTVQAAANQQHTRTVYWQTDEWKQRLVATRRPVTTPLPATWRRTALL